MLARFDGFSKEHAAGSVHKCSLDCGYMAAMLCSVSERSLACKICIETRLREGLGSFNSWISAPPCHHPEVDGIEQPVAHEKEVYVS